MMMARLLLSFDAERRIGVIVFLALIFIFIVYYVIRDLLTSDILLGILSVNLSSAFFGIYMTDKKRWILFRSCCIDLPDFQAHTYSYYREGFTKGRQKQRNFWNSVLDRSKHYCCHWT